MKKAIYPYIARIFFRLSNSFTPIMISLFGGFQKTDAILKLKKLVAMGEASVLKIHSIKYKSYWMKKIKPSRSVTTNCMTGEEVKNTLTKSPSPVQKIS